PHPRIQEAALLLLAQPPRRRSALEPEMVLGRVEAADLRLRQTSLKLLRQRNEWASFASELLRLQPNRPAGEGALRLPPGAWRELFFAFEHTAAVQAVMGEALQTSQTPTLLTLLEALAHSAQAKPPRGWIDGIIANFSHAEPPVRLAAVRAAARWPLEEWSGPALSSSKGRLLELA